MQKIKGRSKSSKSLVITGDNHIGHIYALGSPLRKLRSVNDFWASARDKLNNERCNLFVINGEPIDGDGYKDLGAEQWSTNQAAQLREANRLLKCFKMDEIGMTRGSNYHTTRGNTSFEELFAEMITCAPILDYSPYGKHSQYRQKKVERASQRTKEDWVRENRNYDRVIEDILQVRVHDTVINMIHHTGASSSFAYAPTAIANALLKNLILTGRLWSHKDAPTITVRSHTHQHVRVHYGNTCGFVTPAWQIFSRFMLQKNMTAATIGIVEVVIEPNNKFFINDILLPDKDYPKINVATI